MKVSEAKAIVGNISKRNSKMPGTTYAIDAFACKTGSRLAKIPGTPCNQCYARRLQIIRPSVDKGWKNNLRLWEEADPEQWENAATFLILRYNTDGYHRWFDSGDLQSVQMLTSICRVASRTPQIRHWLPTQEREILRQYSGEIPDNLIIRVSAARLDTTLSGWRHTSNVFTKDVGPSGYECKARTRSNQCGPCRACWDPKVSTISYPKH